MSGARVLHIEDEILIALEVESICLECGAREVRHISNERDMPKADLDGFDVAVVDLSLRGNSTIPLAEILESQGVPLVFMSGLDRTAITGRFPSAQFIGKPFKAAEVIEAITAALASRGI